MRAISRFRVAEGDLVSFRERADAAARFFRACAGCRSADLLQNLDEPDLWCLVSDWVDVGSYRRSFGGFTAKMVLVPVLSEAIDEPSAYASPDEVGENRPRGREGRGDGGLPRPSMP